MRALIGARMRTVEAEWMRQSGQDEQALIALAAAGIYEHARRLSPAGPWLIVCGPGNNGADGRAVARLAERDGIETRLAQPGDPLPGQNRLIIDALLGTGLSRAPDAPIKAGIAAINRLRREEGTPVLSVDLPSCLDATSGRVWGEAVFADVTVAIGWLKTGLLLPNGRTHAGKIVVVPLGVPEDYLEPGDAEVLSPADAAALLPPRPIDSHKGSYGKTLIVAGFEPYIGAGTLCTQGALRGGAGLVRVLCASPDAIRACTPEAIASPYDAATLARELETCSALCIGPGLGESKAALTALRYALEHASVLKLPTVIDADALNLMARNGLMPPPGSVLTPHPGELSRMTGLSIPEIVRDPMFIAREFALGYGCTVLLKGATTVIASPLRLTLNLTGNPGMATAGSGDVLAGLIAALLAQGVPSYDAARLGAYLHGSAGDAAAKAHSMQAMTAGDIALHLGKAFLELAHMASPAHNIPQRDALAKGYAAMSEINAAWADMGLEADEAAFRAYEENLPERE